MEIYAAVGGSKSFVPSQRQISANVTMQTFASGGLRLERQQELLLLLEAVFSFLSIWMQLSVFVALLIPAFSLCLDRQQELMLQLEAVYRLEMLLLLS